MKYFIYILLLLPLFPVVYCCLGSSLVRKLGDASKESGNTLKWPSFNIDSRSACDKVELVNRAEWKAQTPKSTSVISSAVDYVFIHHTAEKKCFSVNWCSQVLQGIQEYHMTHPDRLYKDIAYSFLVGEDGRIYEGRGWNKVGAHSSGYNSKSYGISFMGNYMNALPEKVALNAAKNLIACGQEKGMISASYKLYGHRDIKDTLCPGDMLYNEIRTWPDYGDEFEKTGDTVDENAPDQACTDVSGECQTNTDHCDGSYISGKCSGPSDRQCCVQSESTADSKCHLTDQERSNIQKQLEIDEGRVEYIYMDSEGYLTFGIGHLVTENDPEYGWPEGRPVSPERVDAAFQADLDQAIGDLDKWLSQCGDSCDNYPGEVKEILVNMLFNLGLTRLNGFVNFKKAVCARDWNTAADEMVDSTWYNQVGNRAKRLVERMRKCCSESELTSESKSESTSEANSESTSESTCHLTEQERSNIQKQLEIDEGRVEYIYMDSEGYLTFGIGHLVTENDPEYGWPEGRPVSPERVDAAFQADLDQAIGDLDKWLSQCGDSCDNYPGEVKEILVNMLFNLGLTRLNGFVNFKKAVCAKDWNTAADEMVDSTWYGQVKDRSKRLVERMRNVGGSA